MSELQANYDTLEQSGAEVTQNLNNPVKNQKVKSK